MKAAQSLLTVVVLTTLGLAMGACGQPVAGQPTLPTTTAAATASPATAPPTAQTQQENALEVPADTPEPPTAAVTPETETPTVTAQPPPEELPTATPQPEATPTVDGALLELGKEVYRHQACGVCHTLASVGTVGAFGPPHDDMAALAAQRLTEARYQGSATTPEEYIRESIVDPTVFLTPGYQITRFPMPIFSNLSERELDALVYLLMQPPVGGTE